jgi:hypothetical protein
MGRIGPFQADRPASFTPIGRTGLCRCAVVRQNADVLVEVAEGMQIMHRPPLHRFAGPPEGRSDAWGPRPDGETYDLLGVS